MLAMQEVNENGGLLPQIWNGPFEIEAVVRDAAGNTSLLASMATELIEDWGCIALFGGKSPVERSIIAQVRARTVVFSI